MHILTQHVEAMERLGLGACGVFVVTIVAPDHQVMQAEQ